MASPRYKRAPESSMTRYPSVSGKRRRARRARCCRRSGERGAHRTVRNQLAEGLAGHHVSRPMVYKLISTEGDQAIELRLGPPLVVGRALTSDIPVLDPTISRRHAEVRLDEGGVHVRDLGSSNGTFLNGQKVDTTRISPGDVITFGKVAFRLKELTPTPTAAERGIVTGEVLPRPGATIVRQLPVRDSRQGFAPNFRASGPQRAQEE